MKLALLLMLALAAAPAAAAPAAEWVDAKTGHKVVRISTAPGMASLYFNYNAFTPQGDKMAISTADGLGAIELKTWAIKPVLKVANARLLFTGKKTRNVYYTTTAGKGGPTTIWSTSIDGGKPRKIATLATGSIQTINADETLLAGVSAERDMPLQPNAPANAQANFGQTEYAANGPDGKPLSFAEAKEVRLNERLEAKIPMEMFTINVATGERKVVHRATDWLNHLLFSPTDPKLLMFCHEGPWHKVDRIWMLNVDGGTPTRIHNRTMNMEIAGHEWWAPDGKTIWYDLQTPRGEVFWVAGYDIATQARRWYAVERNHWSVHFNISPDQTVFAGDGGDEEMVAHAPDGKWIYLFRPKAIPDVAGIHAPNADTLIAPGTFQAERLVDMSKHDYRLEPNVHFTPDGKWLIFRSNMEGTPHIYAVEIAKAS